jgi:hypothetical protein
MLANRLAENLGTMLECLNMIRYSDHEQNNLVHLTKPPVLDGNFFFFLLLFPGFSSARTDPLTQLHRNKGPPGSKFLSVRCLGLSFGDILTFYIHRLI